MKDALIQARKLTKTYTLTAERINAVRDVDLDIFEGDFIAVMGPSGSGKTTLLDSLGCLCSITSGTLIVMGKDVSKANERSLVAIRRRFMSFVFQDFLLIPSLTALENVQLSMYFARSQENSGARAMELLEKVGLSTRAFHLPKELSGGEKQRVAIARALAISPKVLFADEPTGNLDTQTSAGISELFKSLNKENGLTIVMTTHNPALTEYAGRVIRLKDGRIV